MELGGIESLSKTTKLLLLDSLLQEVCIESGSTETASLFRAKESPLKIKSSSRKETFSMRCFLSSFLQSFSLILHLSRNVILNPAQRGRRRVSSAPFSAVVPAACRRMALATVNLPGLKITLFLASRILFVKINFWIRISAGQKCCSFNFGP